MCESEFQRQKSRQVNRADRILSRSGRVESTVRTSTSRPSRSSLSLNTQVNRGARSITGINWTAQTGSVLVGVSHWSSMSETWIIAFTKSQPTTAWYFGYILNQYKRYKYTNYWDKALNKKFIPPSDMFTDMLLTSVTWLTWPKCEVQFSEGTVLFDIRILGFFINMLLNS